MFSLHPASVFGQKQQLWNPDPWCQFPHYYRVMQGPIARCGSWSSSFFLSSEVCVSAAGMRVLGAGPQLSPSPCCAEVAKCLLLPPVTPPPSSFYWACMEEVTNSWAAWRRWLTVYLCLLIQRCWHPPPCLLSLFWWQRSLHIER